LSRTRSIRRTSRARQADRGTWAELQKVEFPVLAIGRGQKITEPNIFGKAFEHAPMMRYSAVAEGFEPQPIITKLRPHPKLIDKTLVHSGWAADADFGEGSPETEIQTFDYWNSSNWTNRYWKQSYDTNSKWSVDNGVGRTNSRSATYTMDGLGFSRWLRPQSSRFSDTGLGTTNDPSNSMLSPTHEHARYIWATNTLDEGWHDVSQEVALTGRVRIRPETGVFTASDSDPLWPVSNLSVDDRWSSSTDLDAGDVVLGVDWGEEKTFCATNCWNEIYYSNVGPALHMDIYASSNGVDWTFIQTESFMNGYIHGWNWNNNGTYTDFTARYFEFRETDTTSSHPWTVFELYMEEEIGFSRIAGAGTGKWGTHGPWYDPDSSQLEIEWWSLSDGPVDYEVRITEYDVTMVWDDDDDIFDETDWPVRVMGETIIPYRATRTDNWTENTVLYDFPGYRRPNPQTPERFSQWNDDDRFTNWHHEGAAGGLTRFRQPSQVSSLYIAVDIRIVNGVDGQQTWVDDFWIWPRLVSAGLPMISVGTTEWVQDEQGMYVGSVPWIRVEGVGAVRDGGVQKSVISDYEPWQMTTKGVLHFPRTGGECT